MRTLRQDQRISYELKQDNRGKMSAVNLQPADEQTTDQTQTTPPDEQPAD